MKESFVSFLERHMAARSWNMTELARRAGVTLPELSRVLAEVRPPSMRQVISLAKAFSSSAPRESDGDLQGVDAWAGALVRLAGEARGHKSLD